MKKNSLKIGDLVIITSYFRQPIGIITGFDSGEFLNVYFFEEGFFTPEYWGYLTPVYSHSNSEVELL